MRLHCVQDIFGCNPVPSVMHDLKFCPVFPVALEVSSEKALPVLSV